MRVHSKRYKDDFNMYLDELEFSIGESISAHRTANSISFFKSVYPLFVLLETLSSFEYHIDPTRRLLIGEYLDRNQKAKALDLTRSLNNRTSTDLLIQEAIRKETFTPFFAELYSDAMLLANHYYLNNYRGCHIHVRNLIEDLLRHLYYKDHREEFISAESELTMGLSPLFFREYVTRASYLQEFKKVDEAFSPKLNKEQSTLFGKLEDLYARTSSYVHASKETYMTRHSTNAELKFDKGKADLVESTTREFVKMGVAFLIAAHLDQFMRLNEYDKTIILEGFDSNEKHKFRKQFNV